MPRQIDYYFSLLSPWAYIGHELFREVASTYDLKVNHKPVVLVEGEIDALTVVQAWGDGVAGPRHGWATACHSVNAAGTAHAGHNRRADCPGDS